MTNIKNDVKYLDFCAEIKDICKFDDVQPFTVKWLDEEGEVLCSSSVFYLFILSVYVFFLCSVCVNFGADLYLRH